MSATEPAEVAQAEREIEAVTARPRPRFRRGAGHRHAGEYVRGLLGPVERKNGRQLAEHLGHRHPRTIRRVLDRSAWDADAVRDDLREQVVAALGDDDGVLVIDEAGFVKKGAKSCGVARQYSGTAGRRLGCHHRHSMAGLALEGAVGVVDRIDARFGGHGVIVRFPTLHCPPFGTAWCDSFSVDELVAAEA